jgi:AccI restriction endonuclease
MESFEKILSISEEEIEFNLKGFGLVPWGEFLLNPRRLRGSDFLMRWSQGAWSEHCVVKAVNATQEYFAIEYGPSGVAPDNDVRAYELYFERLDKAGLGDIKRPDLLIFDRKNESIVKKLVNDIGGKEELPFTPERKLEKLISLAIIGVECENSLWKTKLMRDYGLLLTPQKRLNGKPGLKKTAVVPTVIIKDEDLEPLQVWQNKNRIKIHIWHVFFDQAFGISFTKAKHLIEAGLIEPTVQTFQAPGGSTTTKTIYKIYYQYAYELGVFTELPSPQGAFVEDKNGHILPYVIFSGGKLKILTEALDELKK